MMDFLTYEILTVLYEEIPEEIEEVLKLLNDLLNIRVLDNDNGKIVGKVLFDFIPYAKLATKIKKVTRLVKRIKS